MSRFSSVKSVIRAIGLAVLINRQVKRLRHGPAFQLFWLRYSAGQPRSRLDRNGLGQRAWLAPLELNPIVTGNI